MPQTSLQISPTNFTPSTSDSEIIIIIKSVRTEIMVPEFWSNAYLRISSGNILEYLHCVPLVTDELCNFTKLHSAERSQVSPQI